MDAKRRTQSTKRNQRQKILNPPKEKKSSYTSLVIEDHRLKGPSVIFRETPNKGDMMNPKYLVLHFTAGASAESSCNWLCNPQAKASAHLVVGRDGMIFQLAPFNIKTWHAGVSHWDGITGLNHCSIGIEMDNAGPMIQAGSIFKAQAFGGRFSQDEVVLAKHQWEAGERWWHLYSDQQLQIALELAKLLVKTYSLCDIVGHDEIAPDRKRDPGPAFPLESIRSCVMGRLGDEEPRFIVSVNGLNIRRGPGIEFEAVSSPLSQGTELFLLQKGARWHKVAVEGSHDLEGWVANRFITPR